MPNNVDTIPENFSFQGVGIFLSFLEKFKLYQEFFRAGNVGESKKQKYWKHEKAILHWAYSERHQHLGSPLTTAIFKREYGLLPNQPNRLLIRDKLELANEMKADNGNMIQHIMGNLVVKGFAELITRYKDVQLKDKNNGKNNYFVHSIVINRRGLFVGELVYESERFLGLWKYKLLNFGLLLLTILFLVAIIFTTINQIFDEEIRINFSSFLNLLLSSVIYQVGFAILVIVIIIYLWRKIL
ncbi:MAG: hypothetical protein ACD_63C00073G0006 [uncultured bacterium]|nr:MAG: hypothetical protein ACD_63C00073G0006 [uncultured bacterium]